MKTPFSIRRLAIALGAAAVLNVVDVLVATAAGAAMTVNVSTPPTAVGVPMVLGATLGPTIIAAVATWLISKPLPAFGRIAPWIGLGIAALSLPSPFLMATDVPTAVALAIMHVVVGTAWFVGSRPVRA